jgi:hypothetical protein
MYGLDNVQAVAGTGSGYQAFVEAPVTEKGAAGLPSGLLPSYRTGARRL